MDNNKKMPPTDLPDTSPEALAAALVTAKEEADKARRELAAAQAINTDLLAALKTGKPKVPIQGRYRGYTFADNHTRIRDREGALCDTESVLEAAAKGDTLACGIMDWLIDNEYAYLVKVEETAE